MHDRQRAKLLCRRLGLFHRRRDAFVLTGATRTSGLLSWGSGGLETRRGCCDLFLESDVCFEREKRFTAWVDAVIFVFSLENESSFNAIYNYYTKMSHYRNSAEIPLILVGTQDAISENNPRVIDDSRARKLANDLKRCSYYETCATYGLNVERVFQDACQKIVQQRLSSSTSCLTPTNSRPSTPNNHFHQRHFGPITTQSTNGIGQSPTSNMSPSHNYALGHKDSANILTLGNRQPHNLSSSTHHLYRQTEKDPIFRSYEEKWNSSSSTLGSHGSSQGLVVQTVPAENNNVTKFAPSHTLDNVQNSQNNTKDSKDLPTPNSTPTTSRKSRRRSNLFTTSKKGDEKLKNGGDFGSGRAIPLKQGYLYKKSSKPLNKDWKKKYVTLCDDGRLTYHPSLHDYMDDVHSKEISLQYVTVKVPGQKPRGSRSIITVIGANGSNGINEGIGGLSIGAKDKGVTERGLLSALDVMKDPSSKYSQASGDEGMVLSNSSTFLNGDGLKTETPNVKKRHRRMKSSGVKNSEYDDPDGYEFYIVSLDNKQWHFEAASSEERDEWVAAIEQQILNSLQLSESSQVKKLTSSVEAATILSIRTRVPGNGCCVDCDAPNPDWASLNLGVLMCIECSGVHRNLGSHISRVRSLDLDKWPPGHLSVMLAIGNTLANSVWECNIQGRLKPSPNSSREEKEQWIRWKYESKDFLPPPSNTMPLGQQLVDVVCSANIKSIIHVLAQANTEQVNSHVSPRDLRTPLHLACAMGNLAVAQLLIWHNANVKSIDQDGRTPLAYARAALSIAIAKNQTNNTANSEANVSTCRSLIELLISYGCPELSTFVPGSGTLPRRRGNQAIQHLEKLPSSIL
ncbi:centaurin-gamma-1A isoform X2 [Harmonia axyridis]|uniref:centaurin-gamma-1A isoform X2 n=1 Tax=Harmonia axyridis TaxID=115357 RepID=UPI001E278D1D|nr:centaurin-gamma-1A isoform X2 [Harmonia axyridis]